MQWFNHPSVRPSGGTITAVKINRSNWNLVCRSVLVIHLMLLKVGKIGLSVCPPIGIITFRLKFHNFWKTNAIGFKFSLKVRDSMLLKATSQKISRVGTVGPSIRLSVRGSGGTTTIVKMKQSSWNLISKSVMAMRRKLLKMGKIGLSVWPSDSTITLGLNPLKLGLHSGKQMRSPTHFRWRSGMVH